jgi:ribosome modulation factor
MTTTTNRLLAYYREARAGDEGTLAAMHGEPWQSCPYAQGSDERAAWLTRWRSEVARQAVLMGRLAEAERELDASEKPLTWGERFGLWVRSWLYGEHN